jgi:hypothetical protein
MRTLLITPLLALAVAAPSAAAAPPLQVSLTATTHTPKVDAHWRYRVDVTTPAGKPIPARITVQVVDPFGGTHPVEFDCCKRNIVSYPFMGIFCEQVEYPAETRGLKVTFRVIVKALGKTAVRTYWVKPA